MHVRWNHTLFPVTLESLPDGRYRLQVGDWEEVVDEIRWEGDRWRVRQGSRWRTLWVASTDKGVWVALDGRAWFLEAARPTGGRPGSATGHQDGRLRAPVPAQVREIRVREGERVQQGQVVAILEAMKMEFRLQAPFNGVVVQVGAAPGQVVEREWVVVEIRPEESADAPSNGS